MIRGRVTGKIWASRRIANFPSGALLEIETETGSKLVAFDPFGCAAGESVLVTQGSVASGFFKQGGAPIDALIIGSIDEQTNTSQTKGENNG